MEGSTITNESSSQMDEHTYFLESVYETMSFGLIQFIWERESVATIININNAAYRISGYSKVELQKRLNNDFVQLLLEEDREKFQDIPSELVVNGKPEHLCCRLSTYEGKVIWIDMLINKIVDQEGQEICQIQFYDSTAYVAREKELLDKLGVSEQQREAMKYLDATTGLSNMEGFYKKGQELIAKKVPGQCWALIYTTLNNFDYINNRFGIRKGNEVLKSYAELMQKEEGLLLGGRIFSVNFVEVYAAAGKVEVLNMLKERSAAFHTMQRAKFPAGNVFPSVGVYILQDADADFQEALENANIAKKRVLGHKGIICSVYTEDMGIEKEIDSAVAAEIEEAIASHKIEMFLQPKYNIQTKREQGAEAFAIWRTGDDTYRMASEFVSVLEDMGQIQNVDFEIYRRVLELMRKWHQAGKELVPISINFSKLHSYSEDFVEKMIAMAEEYGVDKKYIELEFTEAAFMEAGDVLFKKLRLLHKEGFRINIDEYGAAGSDVRVLLEAPIDRVKISMEMVEEALQSESDREYLKKLCDMLEYLGKDVIFLGVEEEEDDTILTDLTVSGRAQGFFFSAPVPVEEYEMRFAKPEKTVEGVFKLIGK